MEKAFWQNKRILVTGGAGFVGSHVVERLVHTRNVSEHDIVVPRSQQHDLRQIKDCLEVMHDIQIVLHLAADVGGMGYSRSHPASQYYNSILMDLHVMEAAQRLGVERMLAVSSSTAYPATASSPLQEEDMFTGLPYESHLGYGYAKRALIVQAQAFHRQHGLNVAVLVPNNAYGPRDNFDRETSHVIPATIRKCLEDSQLIAWGDGSALRDFMYVEDFAEGVLLAAESLAAPVYLNLASGEEVSIRRLIELIVELTGFSGKVVFDADKPGGEPRRVVNIEKARKEIDFSPHWSLREGLRSTIDWYKSQRQ